MTLTGE